MVLGALGYMNNADFERKLVHDNILLDMFIICQKLRYVIAMTLQLLNPKPPHINADRESLTNIFRTIHFNLG